MKKIFSCFLFFVFYSFFSAYGANEERKIPLSQEMLDRIGIFLALDFAVLPDGDPRKVPLNKFFYIMPQDGKVFELTAENDADSKFLREELLLKLGKYKAFYVINEINQIGAVIREISISSDGEIYWHKPKYSLLYFEYQADMGWMDGAIPLFGIPPKDNAEYFAACQSGKMPENYKPTKQELKEFEKKIESMFRYAASRPLYPEKRKKD